MARRLLVGVAEAGEVNEPRRYLLDLLQGLSDLGVEIQVALFDDGPVRRELERVADVRVMAALPARSPGGLVQSLARRLSSPLADRVHDIRARADLAWIVPPDCIHVHGPRAAQVLRYARTPGVPVTTYAHPWDFSIAGLSPLDLERLLTRTDRFLVADETVAADLATAGVDPVRIEAAPTPLLFPSPLVPPAERAAARRSLGVPADSTVVAVPPVADWVDCPDLTLTLVWELERLAAGRAPQVLWYGMPVEGDRRWPIDYDVARMGITAVRMVPDEPTWEELVSVADLVVLPIRSTVPPAAGSGGAAADRATPLLCWDGHDLADEVARWGGVVVPRGDVGAMATEVWAMVRDPEALRRARSAVWAIVMAEIERLVPVEVPAP